MANPRMICGGIVIGSVIVMVIVISLLAYYHGWADALPKFMDEETTDKSPAATDTQTAPTE